MDKESQKQFNSLHKAIKAQSSDDAKLEKKLDKLIQIQEKQLKISEQTLKKMDILIARTEETNENLGNISINTYSL